MSFTPRSVQKAAISAMSSAVKLALDLLRMFRPLYAEIYGVRTGVHGGCQRFAAPYR